METETIIDTERLNYLSALFTASHQLARTERIVPLQSPDWSVTIDRFGSRVGRFLYRLYFHKEEVMHSFSPTRIVLALALLLALSFEPFLPLAYTILHDSLALEPAWRVVLTFVFAVLVALLAVYGAIGAYWTTIALLRKARISRRLKIVAIVTVIALVGLWFLTGAKRQYDGWVPDAPLAPRVAEMWGSDGYFVVSALLFYLPAITHGAIWLVRLGTFGVMGLLSALWWSMAVQVVYTVDVVSRFAAKPLALPNCEPRSMLQLDIADIDALHEWSTCRREIAQNRLVPMTLVLAFLGLLANTTLGETAVQAVGKFLKEYFAPASAGQQGSLTLLLLVAIVIMFPILLTADLLTEVFVSDFITQACVVVRHTKLSAKASAESENPGAGARVRGVPRPLSWIARLRLALTKRG